jgi:hypothetical protein
MSVTIPIVAIVVISSVVCGGSPAAPDTPRPEPTIAELRAAPLAVTIGGTRIQLQAALWRNFQPTIGPGNTGLNLSVRLSGAPTAVVVDRVWVVFADQVWGTTVEWSPATGDWIARNGPMWETGAIVDVVARLRATDGTVTLLRVADQRITSVA